MENKILSVLVGDDEISLADSLQQKAFLRNYNGLAQFDFETNPDKFIERAKVTKYDALLIDLNWKGSRDTNDTTGFRVLREVKDYSPIRLIHTSNDIDLDLRCAVQLLEGTGVIPKYRSRKYLEDALKGVKI